MSQKEVAQRLGLTPQAISNYERGINKIDVGTVSALCDLYGIGKESLFYDVTRCPVCGYIYSASGGSSDARQHAKRHHQFVAANEEYGLLYNRAEYEKIKGLAYNIIHDSESTYEDKLEAARDILRSYFSRSVDSWGYGPGHPNFRQFAAMLLRANDYSDLGDDIKNALVKEYGLADGLRDGNTYYTGKPVASKNETAPNAESTLELSEVDMQLLALPADVKLMIAELTTRLSEGIEAPKIELDEVTRKQVAREVRIQESQLRQARIDAPEGHSH